jgi:hypothetical protein
MIRNKLKLLASVMLGVVLINSCGVKNNMANNNYTVTPNPLELKGDSIEITISANVPPKSVNPAAIIKFQPVLKSVNGDLQLKEMILGGEKVTESVDVKLNSKTGGKVTYTEKIAYTPDLKRTTMYPSFAVKVKGAFQNVELGADVKPLAEGTNITPLLVSNMGSGMQYDKTPYVATPGTKNINIYFPINVDKFNANFSMKGLFTNKQQIDSLKKVLKTSKDWQVNGININAFASPDGELRRNEGLSKGRSNSTFNYFKKELKKLGFTEANDENFKMGYTLSEDWAGFAKLVEASNATEKNDVLNIINNKSISDEEREAQIKRSFPKFWEMSKTKLLPTLRRSELQVMGQTPLKSDDELKANLATLDILSDTELLQLGKITTDLNQKQSVYTKLVEKYPNDWRGYNNLGSTQYALGNAASGKSNIAKANELSPENGIILVNMANVARMEGDYKKAAELYKQATGKGGDASYGMGVLAIKTGNYADAIANFNKSGVKDFNLALAQLLSGDANAAKATIDNMNPESLTWNCYYLRAIIGARTNNQDLMTTNLTRAVQLSADARTMAKDDVEFIKFWANPVFQSAIR